jgi:hypothetical protein
MFASSTVTPCECFSPLAHLQPLPLLLIFTFFPTMTDSSADPSSSKDQAAAAAAAAEAAAAAAADAQLRKTANQFGALLANVADAPRQRYSLAGLGFGLPLSRLHARYFGECRLSLSYHWG